MRWLGAWTMLLVLSSCSASFHFQRSQPPSRQRYAWRYGRRSCSKRAKCLEGGWINGHCVQRIGCSCLCSCLSPHRRTQQVLCFVFTEPVGCAEGTTTCRVQAGRHRQEVERRLVTSHVAPRRWRRVALAQVWCQISTDFAVLLANWSVTVTVPCAGAALTRRYAPTRRRPSVPAHATAAPAESPPARA
jgi:hypothetical protein